MQRSIFLILVTIFCYGYSIAQLDRQVNLPTNWADFSEEQKLGIALNIIDTLENGIKRKQFIDDFTNTLESDSLLAEAFTNFGEKAQGNNHLSAAENLYFQALRVKRNIKDQEEIGRALFRVGYVLLLQNKQKGAIEYFSESEAIFKENDSYIRLSTVYTTMGEAYYKMNDYEEGLKRLKQGLELSIKEDYEYGKASALLNMSELYIKMGLYGQAISKAKECVLIFEKLEDNESAATANMNIGSAHFYKNENKEASKYYKRALSYEGISKAIKAKIINNLSAISLGKEKYDDALNIYRELLEDDAYIENKELLATTHINMGNLYYQTNKYSEAKKHLAMAENMAVDNNDLELEAEALQLMAYNYHFLGQSDKALDYTDNWRRAEKKRMKEATDAKNYEVALAFNDKLIAEQKQQDYFILTLFAVIAGIIGIFMAIFYAYRQKSKRKLAEQEKHQKIESIMQESEIKTIRAKLDGIDEERDRISKDLHDSIGIMLTGTQLHFEALGDRLDNMEATNRARFNTAFNLLKETQQETRRVIHDMANQTLLNYGLIAQVEELVNTLKTASSTKINFSTEGINTNQWSNVFEMKIYKIIQELINNALKSAQADNLDIQIQQIEDELYLSVKDDGRGFDVTKSNDGMGMRTVEDRVKDLGGKLDINSVIGKGTNISIENIHLN